MTIAVACTSYKVRTVLRQLIREEAERKKRLTFNEWTTAKSGKSESCGRVVTPTPVCSLPHCDFEEAPGRDPPLHPPVQPHPLQLGFSAASHTLLASAKGHLLLDDKVSVLQAGSLPPGHPLSSIPRRFRCRRLTSLNKAECLCSRVSTMYIALTETTTVGRGPRSEDRQQRKIVTKDPRRSGLG